MDVCAPSNCRFIFSAPLQRTKGLNEKKNLQTHLTHSIYIRRYIRYRIHFRQICLALWCSRCAASYSKCDISYPFSFSSSELDAYKMEKLLSLWVSTVTGNHGNEHAICTLRPCRWFAVHMYSCSENQKNVYLSARTRVCVCVNETEHSIGRSRRRTNTTARAHSWMEVFAVILFRDKLGEAGRKKTTTKKWNVHSEHSTRRIQCVSEAEFTEN